MNDFLSRLAQRSIGVAPLLAPRLPGLFAPSEDISNSSIANSLAGGDVDAPVVFPPSISRVAIHTDSVTAEPLVDGDTQSSISLSTTKYVSPHAALIDNAQRHSEAAPVPLIETVQAHFSINDQVSAQENVSTIAPLIAPAAAHAAESMKSSLSPRRRETAQAGPESIVGQWLPLLPQRAAEPAAHFSAGAAAATSVEAVTPSAPTVHITIGRVEVRANIAAPPIAPRPRAASKPVLSLGDYLKSGSGAS